MKPIQSIIKNINRIPLSGRNSILTLLDRLNNQNELPGGKTISSLLKTKSLNLEYNRDTVVYTLTDQDKNTYCINPITLNLEQVMTCKKCGYEDFMSDYKFKCPEHKTNF